MTIELSTATDIEELRGEIEHAYKMLDKDRQGLFEDVTNEICRLWLAVMETQEAIDVLYKKTGLTPPEYKQIIPYHKKMFDGSLEPKPENQEGADGKESAEKGA